MKKTKKVKNDDNLIVIHHYSKVIKFWNKEIKKLQYEQKAWGRI